MKEWVETFIETLAVERGFSPHTCRAYRRDLEHYFTYVDSQPDGQSGESAHDIDGLTIRFYLGFFHKKL